MANEICKLNIVKRKGAHPVTNGTSLRPEVTETLLAGITRRIVEEFHPHQIILFGSYAYGEADSDSDVDLLVVMDSDEPMAQRIIHVAKVAQVRFLPMDILVYTRDEISKRLAKGDFFIIEILTKGKVLYPHDSP